MEYTLEEVEKIATKILTDHKTIRLFWLTGDLGAGKTTFANMLGQIRWLQKYLR